MSFLQRNNFPGGGHPPDAKARTRHKKIEEMPLPRSVTLHLSQHAGAPAEPVVSVGDRVKTGQLIGKANGFISANIHASISGKVKKILSHPHPLGFDSSAILIESDGLDCWADDMKTHDNYLKLTPDEIKAIVKDAGIVGLGGAGFPTNVKLSPPKEKKIDTIIINGAECEPFLTADHRNMLEKPYEIIEGTKMIMHTVSVSKAIIGIERNKPDAIEVLKKATEGTKITVVGLDVKYPQGGEKQLIKSLLNREVPPGKLPLDVGVVAQNIGTTLAIYNAVKYGRPLIKRVITVTGPIIKIPKNLLVRIGTDFKFIIEQCGGFLYPPERVIMGGPMMGLSQYTLSVPVIKGTSGIVALPPKEKKGDDKPPQSCIRCGKCVTSCPLGLRPNLFSQYAGKGMSEEAEKANVMDCLECGLCTFICPADRKNMHHIRALKSEIRNKNKQ